MATSSYDLWIDGKGFSDLSVPAAVARGHEVSDATALEERFHSDICWSKS